MLPSVSSLNDQLLALPPTMSAHEGAVQFIDVVANYINQVQAGPTGSPGILTYTRPPAVAAIEALPPVIDNSWIPNFAAAVHLGVTAGILTPGTVTDPAWTASTVDVLTPVIINLPAGLATLIGALPPVTSGNNPAMPMAQAIHDYAFSFIFLCTGFALALPAPPVPVPLTFPAQ